MIVSLESSQIQLQILNLVDLELNFLDTAALSSSLADLAGDAPVQRTPLALPHSSLELFYILQGEWQGLACFKDLYKPLN